MKNAHERFGTLEYTKRLKDTTTHIRLRLDRFIGEIEGERNSKAHLISVLGGDSDVGAIWAAINEQSSFTVQGPGIEPVSLALGEGAQCFRGNITIAGRKPIRHLVAISAELAKTRPGADPEGKRTVLCDDDPTFVSVPGRPTLWTACGAGVVWLVQGGTQPPAGSKASGWAGMPPGIGNRHEKAISEVVRARAWAKSGSDFPKAMAQCIGALAHSFFRVGEAAPEEERLMEEIQ